MLRVRSNYISTINELKLGGNYLIIYTKMGDKTETISIGQCVYIGLRNAIIEDHSDNDYGYMIVINSSLLTAMTIREIYQ